MRKATINTIIVTILATIGSISITFTANVFYKSTDFYFALILATLCPLILAPPLSFWNFWNGDRIEALNAELMDAKEKLEEYLTYDSMTGLMTRVAFFETVEDACAELGGCMIMIDADHFKSINDTFGHVGGDTALVLIARTILELGHDEAIAGRLGGEEFAIFLPGIELPQATRYAETIRRAIEMATRKGFDGPTSVTVSLGVAAAAPGADVEDIYRAADSALYQSKRLGRNRVTQADTLIQPKHGETK